MSQSLVRRQIQAHIVLRPTTDAKGNTTNPPFIEGGHEVTLRGYRMAAAIKKQGELSMGELQLRIAGLPLSLMNQLATLGRLPFSTRRNIVTVSAGDEQSGIGVCFQGTITGAWADFKGAPEVVFYITAMAGVDASLAIMPPSSFQGTADVATIMAGLAQVMGYSFENNGVTAQLSNPYFPGTAMQQMRACAEAAGIEMTVENQTLIISPRGVARGSRIPLVTPSTGLIGYPSFTNTGIAGTTLYNPSIGFHSLIEIKSDLQPACGRWRITSLTHELESETPGGSWFTNFMASEPRYVTIRAG